MCKELHITIDKELKEVRRTMYEQMENADKEIKRNQAEILELERTIAEIKLHRRGSIADMSR